jgi:hypothetical protein
MKNVGPARGGVSHAAKRGGRRTPLQFNQPAHIAELSFNEPVAAGRLRSLPFADLNCHQFRTPIAVHKVV